ncbi:uncharacterized protein L969DRAFT_96692 [Mixia osmundae IAM 14324]|uniref:Serine aminopeptidase S33 domain-containing protein n=1 Tax=Mixia osmundae (strain CBS 9802 / IAM 14324 / JCM 22182 / KY 12970) TaxID=764103 RepID=G7DSV8_MIXOS|nr:uncharacterized protein L969DRAFT_96692 [Mixia osmundae IAM 14324]KEI37124.1 hypothetical protein L969DRAFT_96692 [Mixia osmundae IAM 14324]GAA93668.1 hypothetical protein E5Q_00313 [Mixia osmundae IAM 14324]
MLSEPNDPWLKWLRIAAGSIIGLMSFTGGMLWLFQCKLIYPASMPADSRTDVWKPSKFGMDEYDDMMLDSPDGEQLHCYVIRQKDDQQSRPTVLMYHANAGNMGHRLPIASVFYKKFRCNVMLLSYRGYGKSTGTPQEKGMRLDAQTALDYILSDPKLEKTPIILYGQSIGGAVAIATAANNERRLHGLIVENTFTSLPELVPSVMPAARPFLSFLTEIWPSSRDIKTFTHLPILFMAGVKDELIPHAHMKELYATCGSDEKYWHELPDGTHNDTCVMPGYFERVAQFIKEAVLHRRTPLQRHTKPVRQDTFAPEQVKGVDIALQNLGAEAGSRVPGNSHL